MKLLLLLIVITTITACTEITSDSLIKSFSAKAKEVSDAAYAKGYADGTLNASCSCKKLVAHPPKDIMWPDACNQAPTKIEGENK